MKMRIRWSEIWHVGASQLTFPVKSMYDLFLSPANLFTEGKSGIPSCQLCAGKCTLRHTMSVCPRELGDGRYRWNMTRYLGQQLIQWTLQSMRGTSGDLLHQIRPVPPDSACKINSCPLSTA